MSDRAQRSDTTHPEPSLRGFRRLLLATLPVLTLFGCLVSVGASRLRTGSEERRPPDLVLEWTDGGRPSTTGPVIRGRSGETVRLAYQVRNVGGSDAYAVLVSAHTALGRCGMPRRLQPGPLVGRALGSTFSLTLAPGMRELCLEARLQTLEADEAKDPHSQDNRRCRKVELVEASTAAPPALGPRSESTDPSNEKER